MPLAPTDPHDVAIVGYGPVGAALALLLARQGLRVLVLERDDAPHALPRAVHLDDETLRVLLALDGSLDPASLGRPIPGMDLVDGERRLLARARKRAVPAVATEPDRRPLEPHHLVHQPDLERWLRARVADTAAIEVRPRHAVESVVPDAGGVTVRGSGPNGPFAVRARWLVGCDGARSRVREAIGSRLRGPRFEERWLVVDAFVDDAVGLPSRLLQVADPGRPATFVPVGGRRKRWEFRLHPHETADAMTAPEAVRRLLAPWVGAAEVEVERAAVYTFRSLTADRWRSGPVLLAGDAAHQMPPFLGEGLGAGLRDAHGLAWRLALVDEGAGAPGLLGQWERERRAHVRAVTRLSVWAGRLIGLGGTPARLRDRLLARFPRRLANVEADLPPLPARTRGARVRALQLVPSPAVETPDGRVVALDVLLGDALTVVLAGADPAAWGGDAGAWRGLPVRFLRLAGRGEEGSPDLVHAPPSFREWMGAGVVAVVVRPDRYLFGRYRADEGPRAAADLRRALGRAPGARAVPVV